MSRISVIVTSYRAQETIDRIKGLLANVSPSNEVEVLPRLTDPALATVLSRYLPKDPRIIFDGVPGGDVIWMTDDSFPTGPFWDLDPSITAQFMPVEQALSGGATKTQTQNSPDIQPDSQEETPEKTLEEVFEPEEDDWIVSNVYDLDDSTKIVIVKKKTT